MTPELANPALPFRQFRHCPKCGIESGEPPRAPRFHCAHCHFVFFFNPAVAAAVFLTDPRRGLLLLRRSREPARGQLTLPGGFIDYFETAEEGLRREIREETGLDVEELRFLCSQVNRYEYQGITYPVVDLFFTGDFPGKHEPRPLDGADALCWLRPEDVPLEQLAFPSVRAALVHWRASTGAG